MEFYLKLAEAQELLKRFNSQRDGILRGECGRGRNRCEVSIPNGMEFYAKVRYLSLRSARFNSQRDGILLRAFIGDCHVYIKFQFPTGWNSTIRLFDSESSQETVSIPNGMEFYHAAFAQNELKKAFQFPTGWNSTKIFLEKSISPAQFQFPTGWNSTVKHSRRQIRRRHVSIPNGMEFYATPHLWKRACLCFNSQRDGILLPRLCRNSEIASVSIPNGMEFYLREAESVGFVFDGFNSQRDGILRMLSSCKIVPNTFQFPTGWNSTRLPQKSKHKSVVSIPNGMEFYSSEKGWQLRCFRFQFPTGWNSTLSAIGGYLLHRSFNSQRDGILLWSGAASAYGGTFQFPTGWNSTQYLIKI